MIPQMSTPLRLLVAAVVLAEDVRIAFGGRF
jgi:hypothetical protein